MIQGETINNEYKNELLSLLKIYSYKTGKFTLSSGKQSSYFLDCKQTLLQAEGHWLAGRILFDEITTRFDNTINAVAGVALGGCSLASAVSTISTYEKYKPINSLYIRKEAKDHGTQNLIEGYYKEGEGVVLFEDVITTGGSSILALDILKKSGLNPIAVMSIVDRLEGGNVFISDSFGIPVISLFSIEDVIKSITHS